jgi:hypothetical protein
LAHLARRATIKIVNEIFAASFLLLIPFVIVRHWVGEKELKEKRKILDVKNGIKSCLCVNMRVGMPKKKQ